MKHSPNSGAGNAFMTSFSVSREGMPLAKDGVGDVSLATVGADGGMTNISAKPSLYVVMTFRRFP